MRPIFFLREAFRSMSRNAIPSFAAIASVLVTVLVLGVFIPIVQATTGAANDVRDRVLVNVYLKTDAKADDVTRVQALLESGRIAHVEQGAVPVQAGRLRRAEAPVPRGLPAAGLEPAARHVPRHAEQPRQRAEAARRARAASAGGGRTTIDPSIDDVKNSKDDTQKILIATRS